MAATKAEHVDRTISVIGDVACQPRWIAAVHTAAVEGAIQRIRQLALHLAIVQVCLKPHRRVKAPGSRVTAEIHHRAFPLRVGA